LDIQRIRDDFPILKQMIHGKPLVYLDNAASSQRPQSVLDSMDHFYSTANSNVHRGVHWLSQEATREFEEVRGKVAAFIGAAESREIIFVRGTTEAINLVAHSYGGQSVGPGDEIIVSEMEHHSNIVPWQMLCQSAGATLRVIPITDEGELVMEEYKDLLNEKTRLVAVGHVSNSLGTVNPVKEIIDLAHAQGVPVLVDGAQAVSHMAVDVRELDCDFYCFSSHKMFGPTGIGVLYGKADLLESMPPHQSGGDMIESVSFEKTTFNVLPYKFEAGTPSIAGVIGLGSAIDYLTGLGFDQITAYEKELLERATVLLDEIPYLRIIVRAR
jgi:cysteine desulfurase/selenocysteine lyase